MDQYQHFFIQLEKSTFICIKAEELIMIEAGDSYATIFTLNGNFLSLMSLTAMEKKLGKDFCRIHRSFIVSIYHVQKILSDTLILTGLREVPIANSYRTPFLAQLMLLS